MLVKWSKVRICYIAFTLVISFIIGTLLISNKRNDPNRIIAQINGEPITMGEYLLFNSENRSDVITYFSKKYNTQMEKDFWIKSFDNEVPWEVLKNKTLEQLKVIKLEQILMKKVGLMSDISYKTFLENFKKENQQRKEKLQRGEPIYGPQEYTEKIYYMLIHHERVNKLKEALVGNDIDVSESSMRQYYEAYKEVYFKKPDYIKVEMVQIKWNNNSSGNLSEKEAADKTQQAYSMIKDNKDFNIVMKAFNENGTSLEKVFDGTTNTNERRLGNVILDSVSELKVNQISNILKEIDYFCILKCVERREQGYYSFEEKEDVVKTRHMDEEYKNLLDKEKNKANIVCYLKKYDLQKITQ